MRDEMTICNQLKWMVILMFNVKNDMVTFDDGVMDDIKFACDDLLMHLDDISNDDIRSLIESNIQFISSAQQIMSIDEFMKYISSVSWCDGAIASLCDEICEIHDFINMLMDIFVYGE
jgi:hypothetical protein